jgi:hypothetical protein
MNSRSLLSEIGVGATEGLSLRVSVATLVRVLVQHPTTGALLLALERKATRHETPTGPVVEVKSQPFGGAIRILDLATFQDTLSEFHFDSKQSRSERDFRIFIRPSDWETVRAFCIGHLHQLKNSVLESDPTRELAEEMAGSLGIGLGHDQYTLQATGAIVEDDPSPTEYIHARGYPTARIYRTFESPIVDPSLASAMLENSENCSDQHLRDLALEDSRQGGQGKANGILTLPFKELHAAYLAIPFEARNRPMWFQGHQLDETVAAVLEDIPVPKYRRLS